MISHMQMTETQKQILLDIFKSNFQGRQEDLENSVRQFTTVVPSDVEVQTALESDDSLLIAQAIYHDKDFSTCTYYHNILHDAAALGKEKIVQLLVDIEYCSVNSKNQTNGRRAIDLAAEFGNSLNVIIILCKADANYDFCDGVSPRMLARQKKNRTIEDFLNSLEQLGMKSLDTKGYLENNEKLALYRTKFAEELSTKVGHLTKSKNACDVIKHIQKQKQLRNDLIEYLEASRVESPKLASRFLASGLNSEVNHQSSAYKDWLVNGLPLLKKLQDPDYSLATVLQEIHGAFKPYANVKITDTEYPQNSNSTQVSQKSTSNDIRVQLLFFLHQKFVHIQPIEFKTVEESSGFWFSTKKYSVIQKEDVASIWLNLVERFQLEYGLELNQQAALNDNLFK